MVGNFLLDLGAAVDATVLVIAGVGIARPSFEFEIKVWRKDEIISVCEAGSDEPALVTMFR